MPKAANARPYPSSWGAGGHGRATQPGWSAGNAPCASYKDGALLVVYKRGKVCRIAKLARLRGEMVLAMPYENRTEVTEYVSLPMKALTIAQEYGARRWVLRFKST